MSRHTPGPWTIGRPSEYGTHNANGVYAGNEGIAQVYGVPMHATLEEVETLPQCANDLANARLIAAAPELLEALKGLLELVEWSIECFGYEADLGHARAAIAKATGEQP